MVYIFGYRINNFIVSYNQQPLQLTAFKVVFQILNVDLGQLTCAMEIYLCSRKP